ncbi:unnamed protein product [Thlaspi arvense]|uniref:Uncharacterized protein n=1 Tax=Thlaspi arvense TaxID=13288 RepID=A0AAU9REF7_THLAR|nr:unnamed protein product [Thlaspi arvense]
MGIRVVEGRDSFLSFKAMVAALITLLVDFMGTEYYERKQEREAIDSDEHGYEQSPSIVVPVAAEGGNDDKVFGEEDSGGIHIVQECVSQVQNLC